MFLFFPHSDEGRSNFISNNAKTRFLFKVMCLGVSLFVIYSFYSLSNSTGTGEQLDQGGGSNFTKNNSVYNGLDEENFNADERFIFLVGISEQETKAQLHMRSISFFSALVNRTIVIPNVGGSRLTACQKHPFSSYYEADEWLAKNGKLFRYISHKNFVNWLALQERLGRRPTGQRARVGLKAFQPQSRYIAECDLKWSPRFNLSGKYAEPVVFDMSAHEISGNITIEEKMRNMTKAVADFMSSIDAQVILLQFGPAIKWLSIPEVNKAIPFSRHIAEQSRMILDFVKPSLVVHWRMETIPKRNIPRCAERLVEDVRGLQAKGNVMFERIYFMTDYPLVGKHSRSITFHSLSDNHMKAIEYLKMNLNLTSAFYDDGRGKRPKNTTHPVTGTKMTFLPVSPANRLVDEGQIGIVEKIVAENARYFSAAIYGDKHMACGRYSNYVKAIVAERRRIIASESRLPSSQRQLANGVHYWGT